MHSLLAANGKFKAGPKSSKLKRNVPECIHQLHKNRVVVAAVSMSVVEQSEVIDYVPAKSRAVARRTRSTRHMTTASVTSLNPESSGGIGIQVVIGGGPGRPNPASNEPHDVCHPTCAPIRRKKPMANSNPDKCADVDENVEWTKTVKRKVANRRKPRSKKAAGKGKNSALDPLDDIVTKPVICSPKSRAKMLMGPKSRAKMLMGPKSRRRPPLTMDVDKLEKIAKPNVQHGNQVVKDKILHTLKRPQEDSQLNSQESGFILTQQDLDRLNSLNEQCLESTLQKILLQLESVSIAKGMQLEQILHSSDNHAVVALKLHQTTQTSDGDINIFKNQIQLLDDDEEVCLIIDESCLSSSQIAENCFKSENKHHLLPTNTEEEIQTVWKSGHAYNKLTEIEGRLLSIRNSKYLTANEKLEFLHLMKTLNVIENQNKKFAREILKDQTNEKDQSILETCKNTNACEGEPHSLSLKKIESEADVLACIMKSKEGSSTLCNTTIECVKNASTSSATIQPPTINSEFFKFTPITIIDVDADLEVKEDPCTNTTTIAPLIFASEKGEPIDLASQARGKSKTNNMKNDSKQIVDSKALNSAVDDILYKKKLSVTNSKPLRTSMKTVAGVGELETAVLTKYINDIKSSTVLQEKLQPQLNTQENGTTDADSTTSPGRYDIARLLKPRKLTYPCESVGKTESPTKLRRLELSPIAVKADMIQIRAAETQSVKRIEQANCNSNDVTKSETLSEILIQSDVPKQDTSSLLASQPSSLSLASPITSSQSTEDWEAMENQHKHTSPTSFTLPKQTEPDLRQQIEKSRKLNDLREQLKSRRGSMNNSARNRMQEKLPLRSPLSECFRSEYEHMASSWRRNASPKPSQRKSYAQDDKDSSENWDTDSEEDNALNKKRSDVKKQNEAAHHIPYNSEMEQSYEGNCSFDSQQHSPSPHADKNGSIKVDATIASPDFLSTSESIASPPRYSKIDLNSYDSAVEINAHISYPVMPYFLHEVSVPRSELNVPRSFDNYNNIMDPRLRMRQPAPTMTVALSSKDPRRHSSSKPTSCYTPTSPYGVRQESMQLQQCQQTPNMLLYSCMQRSPWYQGLMSTMKIQINQTISELVRALNNFHKERIVDCSAVFDVFKIDCAGELLEIMKNLRIFVDAHGMIFEERKGSTFNGGTTYADPSPANATYSFMQQLVPMPQMPPTNSSHSSAPTVPVNVPSASFVSCYIDTPAVSAKADTQRRCSFQASYIAEHTPVEDRSYYNREGPVASISDLRGQNLPSDQQHYLHARQNSHRGRRFSDNGWRPKRTYFETSFKKRY